MFLTESALVKIIKEEMVKAIKEQEEEPVVKNSPAEVARVWGMKIRHLKAVLEEREPKIIGRIEFEFTLAPAVKSDGTVSTLMAKVENIVFDESTSVHSGLQDGILKIKYLRISDAPEGRYTMTLIF